MVLNLLKNLITRSSSARNQLSNDAVVESVSGEDKGGVRLFMVGDVMLGRGVDQIQQHRTDPVIYEDYVKDAAYYVTLAERLNGVIERDVPPEYVWGDALEILREFDPTTRIINLETAVTCSHNTPWPEKGIQYRMHPENLSILSAAEINCVMLANNHVLDWQRVGLEETVESLVDRGISFTGAGRNLSEARSPVAINNNDGGRILIFGVRSPTSGIPATWAATDARSGVSFVKHHNSQSVSELACQIRAHMRAGDIIVVSIHWGPNWGYEIEKDEMDFAHRLIDEAGAHVIHGHSSHHIKGLELYKGHLIIYGAGDFISDYEGIKSSSQEGSYRDDLSLMYFADVSPATGRLVNLSLVPMQLRKLQVVRAGKSEEIELFSTLNRECAQFGVSFDRGIVSGEKCFVLNKPGKQ